MADDPTRLYCASMEEVRHRISRVKSVLAGTTTTGEESADIEFIFIQFRKALELIVFSSLTANKEKYSAAYADSATDWKAKRMLDRLAKVNPDFYPVPLQPPINPAEGHWHFPGFVAEGFLTKEDFVALYQASSEVLHTRNPFSPKDPVIQIGYTVDEWVTRIQTLLRWHIMHLVDGSKWFVTIPSEGPVHVYPASPTD
jgi:hypothetical protein